MKASFVVKEMIYNTVCKDKVMWVDGVQKIIDYVKVVPKSPIILVHFTDGDVMEINEYKTYDFEVNNKLDWKKATKKQVKASKENL